MVSYTVTFDGKSAIVRRTYTVTYRRWLRTKTREVADVVGVYPCRMALEQTFRLNRPAELNLTLGSFSTTLVAR